MFARKLKTNLYYLCNLTGLQRHSPPVRGNCCPEKNPFNASMDTLEDISESHLRALCFMFSIVSSCSHLGHRVTQTCHTLQGDIYFSSGLDLTEAVRMQHKIKVIKENWSYVYCLLLMMIDIYRVLSIVAVRKS